MFFQLKIMQYLCNPKQTITRLLYVLPTKTANNNNKVYTKNEKRYSS